jgi:hypothetical protein
MKYLAGLAHRVAYALVLSLSSWLACTSPIGRGEAAHRVLCLALDWPIAVVGQFVPRWRGVDVFYGSGTCDFCTTGDVFFPHVGLGVVVYVALFYTPTVVLWMVRRWRARSRPHEPAALESPDHS